MHASLMFTAINKSCFSVVPRPASQLSSLVIICWKTTAVESTIWHPSPAVCALVAVPLYVKSVLLQHIAFTSILCRLDILQKTDCIYVS